MTRHKADHPDPRNPTPRIGARDNADAPLTGTPGEERRNQNPRGREIQVEIEERILRRVPIEIFVISLILAFGASLLFSLQVALFVLAGGAFSAFSFLWLKQAIGRFLAPGRRRAVRSGLIFYLIRLVLLLAVFSAIIIVLPRMILAFVAGFSGVIPAFLIEALRAISQSRQWKS